MGQSPQQQPQKQTIPTNCSAAADPARCADLVLENKINQKMEENFAPYRSKVLEAINSSRMELLNAKGNSTPEAVQQRFREALEISNERKLLVQANIVPAHAEIPASIRVTVQNQPATYSSYILAVNLPIGFAVKNDPDNRLTNDRVSNQTQRFVSMFSEAERKNTK